MNLRRITVTVMLMGVSGASAMAQTPPNPAPEKKTASPAATQQQFTDPKTAPSAKDSARAEAYYNFTMGHIYEQQYEATSSAEYATKAIEAYKNAYALDPKSQVIGERLAEMYWKAQRTRDAIAEAQEILKRDPNDVPTRRLLGRIYLRSLGAGGAGQTEFAEPDGSSGQSEFLPRAIEQYREIYRLDPSDSESALWLARLYRLHNDHDKAGDVLRSILKNDPENEAAVEQLTQLLLDQGKSREAVSLLEPAGAVPRGGAAENEGDRPLP